MRCAAFHRQPNATRPASTARTVALTADRPCGASPDRPITFRPPACRRSRHAHPRARAALQVLVRCAFVPKMYRGYLSEMLSPERSGADPPVTESDVLIANVGQWYQDNADDRALLQQDVRAFAEEVQSMWAEARRRRLASGERSDGPMQGAAPCF